MMALEVFFVVYSFNKCQRILCYLPHVPGNVYGAGLSVGDSETNVFFPALKDLYTLREIKSSTYNFFFRNPLLKCGYLWKDNLYPTHSQMLGLGRDGKFHSQVSSENMIYVLHPTPKDM